MNIRTLIHLHLPTARSEPFKAGKNLANICTFFDQKFIQYRQIGKNLLIF